MHLAKLLRAIPFIGVGLTPVVCASACPDYLAGETFDWATVVCEVRNGTDDYLSPAMQSCVKRLVKRDGIGKTPYQNCELNLRYKREWCAYLVKYGGEKSVAQCIKSTRSIPKDISDGGGS